MIWRQVVRAEPEQRVWKNVTHHGDAGRPLRLPVTAQPLVEAAAGVTGAAAGVEPAQCSGAGVALRLAVQQPRGGEVWEQARHLADDLAAQRRKKSAHIAPRRVYLFGCDLLDNVMHVVDAIAAVCDIGGRQINPARVACALPPAVVSVLDVCLHVRGRVSAVVVGIDALLGLQGNAAAVVKNYLHVNLPLVVAIRFDCMGYIIPNWYYVVKCFFGIICIGLCMVKALGQTAPLTGRWTAQRQGHQSRSTDRRL